MPWYSSGTHGGSSAGGASANPTRRALETCLASLEGASHGFAFASGMGATTTVLQLVNPGDRILCANDVYGGTYRLFSKVLEPKGYEFAYPSVDEIGGAIDERTKLVWLETPTNPMMNVVDVQAVSDAAKAVGAPMAGVDLLQGPAGEWYVIEVNAVPGWRALAPVTGVDVAAEIIRFMVSDASKKRE